MREIVERLSADDFQGRRVGSVGGRHAADWLERHLVGLGAVVQTEDFAASAVRDLYATPLLEVSKAIGVGPLRHRRHFAEHLASADLPTPVLAPVASIDTADVAGRWVLADAYDADRAAWAHAAGAVGLVVPRGTDDAGWMPKMIAGPAPGPLPVLSVLAELHSRIKSHASAAEFAMRASVPLRSVAVEGRNIYGAFAQPTTARTSILLTAHFDGVGDDPDVRLPASCDNAAGVAVVIEAARTASASLPSGVGLSVALLDGEEVGAQGSAHHAPRVASHTVVINVDGAAQLVGTASVEAGGPAHALLASLDRAGKTTGVPLAAGAMPSDNRRYAAAGLPTVGIGMGMPGYQTPEERPERVEAEALLAAARLVVACVHDLVATA